MTDKADNLLISLGVGSPAARQLFHEKAGIVELPKNRDIFVEGKKNSSEYLLLSGVAHRYNLTDDRSPVTTGFYLSPSVITPHFARTGSGKSIFSLQSLTDVVLAQIAVAELDSLRYSNKEFQQFGQRVVEAGLAATVRSEVVFRALSAKERLLAMRKQYPSLENLVPHHIIASYLGITHVSFSRLRNSLSRK